MQVERLNVSKANVVQINDSNLAAKGKKQSVIASVEATSKSNSTTKCSPLLTARIRKYLAANYGVNSANVFKNNLETNSDGQGNLNEAGRQKVREIYMEILQKEFRRTYKTAYAVGDIFKIT